MDSAKYKTAVAAAFNKAAATYDRAGVEFFTPMGRRLIEMVAPRRGDRVLDIGCGRGASLFPAAAAVGPAGHVVGIDIAGEMIDQARAEAAAHGVRNIELQVADAESVRFPAESFEVVTGSFSIIFLPDSFAALTKFARLLVPGGRIGFTSPVFTEESFPFLPPLFTGIITDEFLRHVPEEWNPYRLAERRYAWLSDIGRLESTCAAAGLGDVVVHDEPVRMVTGSGHDWVVWSRTQGMRLLWDNLPDGPRRRLERRIVDELETLRGPDGLITLEMPVRYVLATARPAR